MKKLTGIFITLGTALLVVVSGLVFRAVQAQNTSPFGPRPVRVWSTQPEQSFAQTPDGIFGANAVLVTPKEIIIFYELQSQLPGIVHVEAAFSNIDDGSGKQTPNFVTVDNNQFFDKLAEIGIGAIHITRADQPDQALNLRVTPAGSKNPPWQITPLEQLAPDQGKQGVTFIPIQSPSSVVKVELGNLGGESSYAILKLSLPSNPDIPPIFLQVDRQSVISQITETEFNALTSPSISPDTQNPTMATPAPPEKP